jgi:hypothetical protein
MSLKEVFAQVKFGWDCAKDPVLDFQRQQLLKIGRELVGWL